MVLGAMRRNTDRCVLCFHGCGAATKPIDDQTDSSRSLRLLKENNMLQYTKMDYFKLPEILQKHYRDHHVGL